MSTGVLAETIFEAASGEIGHVPVVAFFLSAMLVGTAPIALAASMVWGAADFVGGLTTRSYPAYRVVLIAHGWVALVLWAAILSGHPAFPGYSSLAWAMASGLFGGLGLICFYQSLSLGKMGVAAAIAGLLTAALPVAASLFLNGRPSARQAFGFVTAAVAIALVTHTPKHAGSESSAISSRGEEIRRHRQAIWLAVAAGTGFGLLLIGLKIAVLKVAGTDSGGVSAAGYASLLWIMAGQRAGSTAVAAVMVLASLNPRLLKAKGGKAKGVKTKGETWGTRIVPTKPSLTRIVLILAMLAGLLDASGNFLYTVAARLGRMDVAAVLGSLYPAVTIVLAMVFLKERANRYQAAGMVLAVIAVVLISI